MDKNLEKILSFLEQQHLLCLATCKDNQPSSCSLFYAFDKEAIAFIVASDEETEHIKNSLKNSDVAGSVHLQTKIVGRIQGVQFKGNISLCDEAKKSLYFKKFPYALAMKPTLWVICVDFFKMTDNTLGFGKKLTWARF